MKIARKQYCYLILIVVGMVFFCWGVLSMPEVDAVPSCISSNIDLDILPVLKVIIGLFMLIVGFILIGK